MFPTVSHILYDLGNTLLYFHGDRDVVFRQAVAAAGRAGGRFGLDPDRQAELTRRLAARLLSNYARRETDLIELAAGLVFVEAMVSMGFPPDNRGPADAVMSAFYAVTQTHWRPVRGAEQALALLKEMGYRQAVLSNAAHDEDVQALVDKAGLRPYLDFVLTSAAIGRRKPDPQPFLRAAADWGVSPAVVLMVGDMMSIDVRGARAAGMAAVWVQKFSRDPSGEVPPDAMIETVVELPQILTN
ncbi:MAG TPA: HAD family hydrolase [Anaerolineales bacterium]|nr:HAD family hydrolase [Anaerolineales bacterium]